MREVQYLGSKGLYSGGHEGRFANVFTKLRVFSLEDYDKVVLLDTDLLVRRNLDELFLRPVPSALRRHAAASFEDGARIDGAEFFDANGHQTSGINAGVVVLKPSIDDFEVMCQEIADEAHPEHHRSRMPEQDYLTRFYVDSWHALGVHFNYQPHQLAFTDRGGLEQCPRLAADYGDVFVVHFSACPKPCDWLIEPRYASMSRTRFADDVLCRTYLEGMARDRRRGPGNALGPAAIEAQMRSVTWCSTLEWFEVWDKLVSRLPQLCVLVAAVRTARATTPPTHLDSRCAPRLRGSSGRSRSSSRSRSPGRRNRSGGARRRGRARGRRRARAR